MTESSAPPESWRPVLGMLLVPLLLVSGYLVASRPLGPGHSGDHDWIALWLSLAVGLPFVFRLPIGWGARLGVAVGYVVVGAGVLLVYALFFVGFVFGDWL